MSDVGVLVGDHLVLALQLLMISERALGGLVHPEKIEEMDKELTEVIEDFDRAMNIEALRLARETSKYKLFSHRRWPNLNRFV